LGDFVITEAIVCDEDGAPFTPERFLTEPEAAQMFLELIENNSFRVLPQWRELPNQDILTMATNKLSSVQQDLITAEFLKARDLTQ
jgi:hypothetical protein